jgi:hypothetical protein
VRRGRKAAGLSRRWVAEGRILVVWPFYFVRHGFLSIPHSFLLQGFLSGASYEMEFTEGADMMPPRNPLEVSKFSQNTCFDLHCHSTVNWIINSKDHVNLNTLNEERGRYYV